MAYHSYIKPVSNQTSPYSVQLKEKVIAVTESGKPVFYLCSKLEYFRILEADTTTNNKDNTSTITYHGK